MKKVIFIGLVLGSVWSYAADSGINPSNLKIKVFKLSVSTSPLCTNLLTVFESSSPDFSDMLTGPSLGSGSVAQGTYPCIVIDMSDNVKFTPAANSDSGNCLTSTESTLDVCSSGSSVLSDGTTTTCDSGDNRVSLYLSTASTSTTGADAFNAPTSTSDATKGFNLGSSLTVSATAAGTFVVNGTGKVSDQSGSCELDPPLFSFR